MKFIYFCCSILFALVLMNNSSCGGSSDEGGNKSDRTEDQPEEIPSEDPEKPVLKEEKPKAEERKTQLHEMTYDFSCMTDDDKTGLWSTVVNAGSDFEDGMWDQYGEEVTVQDEEKVGEQMKEELEKDIVKEGKQVKNLKDLLRRLVRHIQNPKGFDYEIFYLNSDELNAFTVGGKIFITKKMYAFCENNDELACVIGHEICHNELGHIRRQIQSERLLQSAVVVKNILTLSFGQKKEAHCDMMGVDLAIAAGYNGCVAVGLWKRMKEESEEGDTNAFLNLLRSHPYSEIRSVCLDAHIQTNYGHSCSH
ncbi:MAG: M48 family metallopeptidase [Flavobacteriales bacterium]